MSLHQIYQFTGCLEICAMAVMYIAEFLKSAGCFEESAYITIGILLDCTRVIWSDAVSDKMLIKCVPGAVLIQSSATDSQQYCRPG